MARSFSVSRSLRPALALGALAAVALAAYLAASAWRGFPLDDAWIHQTYARTLAQHGQWAFLPGQPSAGATSVLWVLLLTPGVWLSLSPLPWVALLGWLTLWVTGLLAARCLQAWPQVGRGWALAGGALLMLEFHLVWAAASGMETALFALLCLAALYCSLRPAPNAWAAGALAGLALLARPEGLTLLAPLAVAVWHGHTARRQALLRMLAGFLLFLLPYLLFNQMVAGTWWPNTFYAKQAEYAELLAQPLLLRWGAQLAQPLIGVGLLALPGFLFFIYQAVRARQWRGLAWVAWLLGFALLFALRLPVTYQHGRYAMPLIPVFWVLAVAGAVVQLHAVRSTTVQRQLRFAWAALLTITTLAFCVLGARAYATDVAFIETHMVATARWVGQHTAPDALVAAHDIGALGYFAPRPLIDLAGLVSPEVVAFMRDEARLGAHLTQQGAEYVLIFPGWYPRLSQQGQPLFSTGPDGMLVLRWGSP